MDLKQTKNCIACDNEISGNATICSHCGTSQGRKRVLNLTNSLLALVVAILSVAAFAIPIIKDSLVPESSKDNMKYAFSKDDQSYFILENAGKKPALLESFYINLKNYQLTFTWEKIGSKEKDLIDKNSVNIYRLKRSDILKNEFLIGYATGEEGESYAEFESNWQEYFPENENESEWKNDWCLIPLQRYHSILERDLFDSLDDLVLDWEVENNRSRINGFIEYFNGVNDLPEDDVEIIESYQEATKLTPIIKNCVFSDSTSIKANIVNSNGEIEKLNVLVSSDKIQEFVFPFIMGNRKYTKEEYSYFLKDYK